MPEINFFNKDNLPSMRKMKNDEYDLAIVDPQYGFGDISHCYGVKVKHKKMTWNDAPPPDEYFEQLFRISKNQIIWGCNYFYPHIKVPGRIVHYKDISGPLKNAMSDCDLASQSFNNRIDYFPYRWSGNVQGSKINWKNTGSDARIHPTQKPIILYKWTLEKYAKKGDRIIETHGGSMSIAIACYDLGFDLDIYEIDKEHFDNAVKRFEIYKSQLKINFNS